VVPRAAEFSRFPFAINQFQIRGVQLQYDGLRGYAERAVPSRKWWKFMVV
jgi:hypothetical protein